MKGFSGGLYSYWRDENGDPRSARDTNGNPIETSSSTLKQVTYTDWSTFNGNVEKSVSLLTTPKIVVNQIDNIIIYSFFCLKALHHALLILVLSMHVGIRLQSMSYMNEKEKPINTNHIMYNNYISGPSVVSRARCLAHETSPSAYI